jgi:hypothetical protein
MTQWVPVLEWNIRNSHALPEGFDFFSWCVKDQEIDGKKIEWFELEGGVAPLFKRGPRKGKKNWKKSTDRRKFAISMERANEIAAEYRAAGMCDVCGANGKRSVSWSRDTGTSYEPCRACNGTGRFEAKEVK